MSVDGDPLVGQHLDHFLVQQPLGRGGMARVYKGFDTLLKRPVAIKVIGEGYRTSSTYAQRFEREAQAVASLKHPNIVTIHSFGQHDSLYYLVMEFIDGADLDAILRNYETSGELMPHADVLRIVEAVASALDYAHGHGVIHRDVKPSNIMLERDGRIVLTDFGLALRTTEGTIGDTFGSPHYVSPEQARNSANAVAQSDLYSLGVVTYELLVGVTPFDDPSATALALQHIMVPVPSPRAFNRNLSEQIDQVLFKALAKTPEERYATGAMFLAALREAVEGLRQHPVKVATNELPPLPPGVVPPPPRRMSMQTTVDKLQQELALAQARGQALTRQPPPDNTPGKPKPGRRMPVLIVAILGLLGLIALVAVLTSNLPRSADLPTLAAALPTDVPATPTSMPLPTSAPSVTASAVLAVPTMPPATLIPTVAVTNTPVVPTQIPPTIATTAPTAFPAPATMLVAPPATTPVPTTLPPTAPSGTAVSTVAYPEGLLFTLLWDDQAFYVANTSGRRVRSQDMGFERIGGKQERYEGRRWSAFYGWNEPRRCLVLRLPRARFLVPAAECPDGYNSDIQTQSGEAFWTPATDSQAFRVLWMGSEVGRCVIAASRCEVRFPPN
jgi:serine/threonine protein kinase